MTDDVSKKLTEERGKTYGHPLDDFDRVSLMNEVVKKCKDPAVRHALYMICVKVARLVETPDHQDSIDDIKGYAETINMIHDERNERELREDTFFDAAELTRKGHSFSSTAQSSHILKERKGTCLHGYENWDDCPVCRH